MGHLLCLFLVFTLSSADHLLELNPLENTETFGANQKHNVDVLFNKASEMMPLLETLRNSLRDSNAGEENPCTMILESTGGTKLNCQGLFEERKVPTQREKIKERQNNFQQFSSPIQEKYINRAPAYNTGPYFPDICVSIGKWFDKFPMSSQLRIMHLLSREMENEWNKINKRPPCDIHGEPYNPAPNGNIPSLIIPTYVPEGIYPGKNHQNASENGRGFGSIDYPNLNPQQPNNGPKFSGAEQPPGPSNIPPMIIPTYVPEGIHPDSYGINNHNVPENGRDYGSIDNPNVNPQQPNNGPKFSGAEQPPRPSNIPPMIIPTYVPEGIHPDSYGIHNHNVPENGRDYGSIDYSNVNPQQPNNGAKVLFDHPPGPTNRPPLRNIPKWRNPSRHILGQLSVVLPQLNISMPDIHTQHIKLPHVKNSLNALSKAELNKYMKSHFNVSVNDVKVMHIKDNVLKGTVEGIKDVAVNEVREPRYNISLPSASVAQVLTPQLNLSLNHAPDLAVSDVQEQNFNLGIPEVNVSHVVLPDYIDENDYPEILTDYLENSVRNNVQPLETRALSMPEHPNWGNSTSDKNKISSSSREMVSKKD